jgi:multidrug efflux pump subunit AcrA (membrane-fusion protein)
MEKTAMPRNVLVALPLIAAVFTAATFGQDSSQMTNPVIQGALVKVADSIKLPAKEPGVLVQLAVKDGAFVRANQVLGKIDDSEPLMQKKAANAAYSAAYEKWKDDVEVRYATAQAAVAKAKYQLMLDSNKISARAVTQVELDEARLDHERAVLGIEKSGHDKKLAAFDAMTKKAELEAAEMAIQRRVVTAPFDGVVEEIKRHQDEWVQPGDTILNLLRMDTLHVEGAVEQSKYDPHEIANCNVTVDVEMARGRKASFRGRIIKVSSVVQSHGVFYVRAEIANQQEHGAWLLQDGLPATMTIHLGTGGAAAAGVSRSK